MTSLADVTIPTPQAYDAADPTRQVENLAYVVLQLLTVAKAAADPDWSGILVAIAAAHAVINVAPAVSVDADDIAIKIRQETVMIEGY